MAEQKRASVFSRAFHRPKKIFLFFLKVMYVIPFFALGLWLISIVYFPGFDLNASVSLLKYRNDKVGFKIISQKKETIPRDHFHMVDEYVEGRDAIEPVKCLENIDFRRSSAKMPPPAPRQFSTPCFRNRFFSPRIPGRKTI